MSNTIRKPALNFWQIWNMSFGFFGIQIGFGLQNANVSRIFQTLGVDLSVLPLLWLAGPVTGLLVQPLIGHFSDRTWTGLGRRRPYFLTGAILTTLALLIMPNSPYLWVAAASLWILDAALNVTMEPFRAFVGDNLPRRQRTLGFSMQTIFIGLGAFLASIAPWVMTQMGIANVAPEGVIPDSVRYSFYIGAAALFFAILWTVFTSKEYSPEQLDAFEQEAAKDASHPVEEPRVNPGAGFYSIWGGGILAVGVAGFLAVQLAHGDKQLYILGGAVAFLGLCFLYNSFLMRQGKTTSFLSQILSDLVTMPHVMKQLAVVQFFSWFALFVMWIYSTPAVTSHHFGATDVTSIAYNEGANWVGWMFAVYNLVAAIYAFIIPALSKILGMRLLHGINLAIGGVGLVSYFFITDPKWLMVSMACVGIAWASILSLPYAILSTVLPVRKMGIYMGIFNFFIVLPQLVTGAAIGPILRDYLGGEAILALLIGGAAFLIAAISVTLVRVDAK
ncbi:MAG: MFS transporter [bacterium]